MRRPMVYVAGPYSSDPANNVHRAAQVWSSMVLAGLAPFVPHLTHEAYQHEPVALIELQLAHLEILARCDHLYRMTGESSGADREVDRAIELGIPVWLPGHGTLYEFIEALS